MAKSEKEKQIEKEVKQFLKNDETIAQLDKKIKQLQARKADAENKAKEKIRKARTHRLCTIAGDIEKIFGHALDIESEEYKKFIDAVRTYVNEPVAKENEESDETNTDKNEKADEPFRCYFEDDEDE